VPSDWCAPTLLKVMMRGTRVFERADTRASPTWDWYPRTSGASYLGGIRTNAPRAPLKAFARNAASPISPGHGSAPFEARGPRRTRSLPITRTGSPAPSSLPAILEPTLPVAPQITNGDFIVCLLFRFREVLRVRFPGSGGDPNDLRFPAAVVP
jgi:hypothetical protein